MPPPPPGSSSGNAIDKLDYHPSRPLLSNDDEGSGRPSQEHSYAGSFFEQVAEGILDRDRAKKTREVVRYGSFAWALINCLCAGSITAFSLYAPLLQRRLHYSQLRVNTISIAAELGMYLPVPLSGYLCDRYGPGIPSFLSGSLFGAGYLLAAFTYKSGPPASAGGDGWPFAVMVVAFVCIGVATSGMYLAAVTTCAKNFGRGKHKGLALALPIAAFGLSGMWQSQIGSRLLYETRPDGSRGDVDVFRYFLFLGITLLVVGVIGTLTLQVVDEEEMIDEAVEELERSGLLDDSELFHRIIQERGYGTLNDEGRLTPDQHDSVREEVADRQALALREKQKKTWLLNEETRRFLSDKTMWLLAFGFFLITGPGEAFINNLGTILDTLYPADTLRSDMRTTPATHVSIVAITSTLARIFTGTLSDILAPAPVQHQHRRGPNSMVNSMASLYADSSQQQSFHLSRIVFLIVFSLLLSVGQVLLASGFIQDHAERFWLVSATIGAGYGAVFSLTPIIVSVVWGVENFGTNWGIVATVPAAGATVWGLIYSGVYESAATAATVASGSSSGAVGSLEVTEDLLCHGTACYAPTFWAMAVSVWIACAMWFWAWRGKGGWVQRGVAV
ncbi:MFS monocarboxylic acid transporter-like protein [Myriangium duriaei CBS 260.36]|uniref:Probable transporter MCH1 n=1 Tax=Myriangium duriaei CBS 260.36 TaxID=1168546 RepID=A0A9P4ISZ5_9PEZI|nr:MFS monocarboxylic acid transporter-like protein [Myriangium duriaei CBS 260.36]